MNENYQNIFKQNFLKINDTEIKTQRDKRKKKTLLRIASNIQYN